MHIQVFSSAIYDKKFLEESKCLFLNCQQELFLNHTIVRNIYGHSIGYEKKYPLYQMILRGQGSLDIVFHKNDDLEILKKLWIVSASSFQTEYLKEADCFSCVKIPHPGALFLEGDDMIWRWLFDAKVSHQKVCLNKKVTGKLHYYPIFPMIVRKQKCYFDSKKGVNLWEVHLEEEVDV